MLISVIQEAACGEGPLSQPGLREGGGLIGALRTVGKESEDIEINVSCIRLVVEHVTPKEAGQVCEAV